MGQASNDPLVPVDGELRVKRAKRDHTPRDIDVIDTAVDDPAISAPAASVITVPSVPAALEGNVAIALPEVENADAEDIARTRAEMTETIDAIKERLNPEVLKEEARETVEKTVAATKADAIKVFYGLVAEARTSALKMAVKAQRMIRENPGQATAVGVILGLFLVRGVAGRIARR